MAEHYAPVTSNSTAQAFNADLVGNSSVADQQSRLSQPLSERGPPEAGPSRIRRSSSGPEVGSTTFPQRPASPSNVLPQSHSRGKNDADAGGDGRPSCGEDNDTDASRGTANPPAGADEEGSEDGGGESGLPRPSTPYLDLATYPTQNLLRLLASLLQQIASANDQLRPEMQEDMNVSEDGEGSSTSGIRSRAESRASDHPNPNPAHAHAHGPDLHPSPTTALFSPTEVTPPANSAHHRKTSVSPTTGRAEHLFTASKTSLSHHSSLLSFHARHVPSITIEAYLLRILKYCPTTNEVFLGLLVYFDRMSRLGTAGGLGGLMQGGAGKGFAIDSYNVHRLVIAGVTVASKFFSDVFYTNSRYAKVGGLPPHELNQLELQFLLLNDFRLVIPADEMQRYGNRLLGYWENKEAEERERGNGASASASEGGMGAPTEDQVKAATAMVKNESGSGSGSGSGRRPATAVASPTSPATPHRPSPNHEHSASATRPSAPRQSTQPAIRADDHYRPNMTDRRSSFDNHANPASASPSAPSNGNGQSGPPTNAIPTA